MPKNDVDKLRITVSYAMSDNGGEINLLLNRGATAREAIEASGILDTFTNINLDSCTIGIWGKVLPLDTPLRQSDRVEIYRPLNVDPKQARRRRAGRKHA